MSVREELQNILRIELTNRRHQTGLATVHSDDLRDLIGEIAEERVPEFKEMPETEQEYLLDEIVGRDRTHQCPAVIDTEGR